MAIEKKGKTDFLRNVDAAQLTETNEKKDEKDSKKAETKNASDKAVELPKEENKEKVDKKSKKAEKKAEKAEKKAEKKEKKAKKEKKNGRPRKLLIEGEKEKSITLQLPKSLIKALRKLAKKEDKSMKQVIGSALLEKYGDLLKK